MLPVRKSITSHLQIIHILIVEHSNLSFLKIILSLILKIIVGEMKFYKLTNIISFSIKCTFRKNHKFPDVPVCFQQIFNSKKQNIPLVQYKVIFRQMHGKIEFESSSSSILVG